MKRILKVYASNVKRKWCFYVSRVYSAAQNPREGAAPNVRSNPVVVQIRLHFWQVFPQRAAGERGAGERAIA